MPLNLNKRKSMSFSRKYLLSPSYRIAKYILEHVCNFVDLAVTMNTKLNFNLHIDTTVLRAKDALAFARRGSKEFKNSYIFYAISTTSIGVRLRGVES